MGSAVDLAFNDQADALAKQAAATHPLQSRHCALRRPSEPLAPSGACNVRPKMNAEGVPEEALARQPVLTPQQPGVS